MGTYYLRLSRFPVPSPGQLQSAPVTTENGLPSCVRRAIRVALGSVSRAGVRTYFVGDRPEGGKWGYRYTSDKTGNNLLDNITVYGRYTCTRVNLDGEGEVPTIGLNVWKTFCSGVERHFSRLKWTCIRLASSHDSLSMCPASLSKCLPISQFDYLGNLYTVTDVVPLFHSRIKVFLLCIPQKINNRLSATGESRPSLWALQPVLRSNETNSPSSPPPKKKKPIFQFEHYQAKNLKGSLSPVS
jgi:hypothetical protein